MDHKVELDLTWVLFCLSQLKLGLMIYLDISVCSSLHLSESSCGYSAPGYVLVVAWRRPWLPVQRAALLAVNGLQSRWEVPVLWCDRVASLRQCSWDGSGADWSWHHDSVRRIQVKFNQWPFTSNPFNCLISKEVFHCHFRNKLSVLCCETISLLHKSFYMLMWKVSCENVKLSRYFMILFML